MNIRLILALLLCFSLLSCTPRAPSREASESPESQNTAPASGEDSVLRLTKSGPAEESEEDQKTQEEEAEEIPEFTGPLYLQRINPHAYHLPTSLMIGDLADPLSAAEAEREVYDLAGEFWESLAKGSVRTSLVSRQAHPLFAEEVEEFLDMEPEIVHVYSGSIRFSGQTVSIKTVLLSDSGNIRGDLYFRKDGDRWLVEDWEIPFRIWPGRAIPLEKDLTQMRYSY
ncbi:MAG: hypothetical protein PQJ50_01690 [Spirochaetales bacterium]|nr:hypothetical protein [Spirochaetales bacterium]